MKMKKRKDGRVMKSRTVNGKRIYGYGRTQKEAQEDLDAKVERAKAGLYKPGKELTLDGYFEKWMKGRELSIRASTLYAQKCEYQNASAFPIDSAGQTLGSLRLSKIEAQNIRDLQAHLAEKHSTGYTNQVIGVIRHMLNDAVKERIIDWNPCDALKSVKRTEEEARDTIHRALTEEETVKFFEAAKDSYYIHLYTFLINTGLRIGEAGGLYVSDIHDGKIRVKRTLTKTSKGETVVGEDVKTKAGIRTVPLTKAAAAAITAQRATNAILFDGNVTGMEVRIFRSAKGLILKDASVSEDIRAICEKAGVTKFTPHAFRDTFATRAIESGMNPKTLQEILGHSDIGMTMNLYAHVMEETKEKEMSLVEIKTV